MDVSLMAVGAAAPGLRLAVADVAAAWGEPGGSGQVAVCASDEDALTLAWEAGRRALAASGLDADAVDGLWWGSATPPFLHGPNLAYLAASLGLGDRVEGGVCSGGRLAGVDALAAAGDAVAAGRIRTALVVASDAPVPGRGSEYERHAGAAGVALVVTSGRGGPAVVMDRASVTRPHLDQYQGQADGALRDVYDGRLFREEVFLPSLRAVVDRLGDEPVDAWALPDPNGRLGRRLAADLGAGADRSADLRARLGDTGAAAAVLGLATCLTAPGRTVALAHGDGRSVAIAAQVTSTVPGTEALAHLGDDLQDASYTWVLRARRLLRADTDPIDMAVPPGGAGFVRGNEELLGLHGARCDECGTISTPPSVHPTCIGCGGDRLTPVPLARTGVVHTFVVNATMPAPFEAPLPLLVVDLDDGARLMVHGVAGRTELDVGDRVELVLRRYALERGAPIYGFKAAPSSRNGAVASPAAVEAGAT